MSPDQAPLELGEAVALLGRPDAAERFSPLGDRPLLLVDLGGEAALDTGRLEATRTALARLPCPSVGLYRAEPSGAGVALGPALDLLVDADGLAPILDGVARTPLAAAALAQLLRLSESLDAEAGLIAESLVYSMLQTGPEFAAWCRGRPSSRRPQEGNETPVRIEREGSRLRLVLDRPRRHNAFSAAMRDALNEGLELALWDPSIARIVLQGAGPSFCSGGDLDEFGSLPDPATAHAVRSTRSPARLLLACARRVRAEVHGACLGAGIELAAFASRVVAHPDSFFQLPELSLGLVPGAGGTVSLPRRVGRQRTAWLALSGRRIDAATAHAWGLVDEIRPPG